MRIPESQLAAPESCRVQSIKQETADTYTLELVRDNGEPFPDYTPGQYNVLHVPGGQAPMAICIDPAEPGVLMHTIRAIGKTTRTLTGKRVGDEVGVSGPYGCGWPLTPAEGNDIVIICGGIGLAPVRPLLYALIQHRVRYGHITMVCGARTPEDILFRRELEAWRGRFDMEVLVTVDRATGNWRGHVGVFSSLIPRAPFDPYFSVAYLSGPEIMMTYAAESLSQRGVGKDMQYLYMQRDMKRHIQDLEACELQPSQLTGPVFRLDQVEPALMARE